MNRHWSLQPLTSIWVGSVSVIGAAVLLATIKPFPVLFLAVGAVGGLLDGWLHGRALHETPERFVAAETPREAYGALWASRVGATAIVFHWMLTIALFALALLVSPRMGFPFLAGILTSSALREAAYLPSLLWLERRAATEPQTSQS
jgi:cobalamin synthase